MGGKQKGSVITNRAGYYNGYKGQSLVWTELNCSHC